MVYLCNERTREYVDLRDVLNLGSKNISYILKLVELVPKWNKSDVLFINKYSDSFDYKEIKVKDFDKRTIDLLEENLVNIYKNLFNICLNEIKIKGELKDDFEVI